MLERLFFRSLNGSYHQNWTHIGTYSLSKTHSMWNKSTVSTITPTSVFTMFEVRSSFFLPLSLPSFEGIIKLGHLTKAYKLRSLIFQNLISKIGLPPNRTNTACHWRDVPMDKVLVLQSKCVRYWAKECCDNRTHSRSQGCVGKQDVDTLRLLFNENEQIVLRNHNELQKLSVCKIRKHFRRQQQSIICWGNYSHKTSTESTENLETTSRYMKPLCTGKTYKCRIGSRHLYILKVVHIST